jgi:hypothetical protein
MRTAFVKGMPPQAAFLPFNHVPNQVPLDQGVSSSAASADAPTDASTAALAKAWATAKTQMFKGKLTKPDAEDPDVLSHQNWYEATGFTRPYPGETKVRAPSSFKNLTKAGPGDSDD